MGQLVWRVHRQRFGCERVRVEVAQQDNRFVLKRIERQACFEWALGWLGAIDPIHFEADHVVATVACFLGLDRTQFG